MTVKESLPLTMCAGAFCGIGWSTTWPMGLVLFFTGFVVECYVMTLTIRDARA